MKINELRIGNWVNDKHPRIARQVAGWMFIQLYRDLDPIPLSEDILKKIGCVQGQDKEMWRHSCGVWLTRIGGIGNKFFINGFRSGHYIEYLHQYQNACLVLTGEEIEINL